MTNWIFKIKIRDIFKDEIDDCDEFVKVPIIGKQMKERLSEYSFIPKTFGNRFSRIKTINGFDKVLNDLYDYCDVNSIWVEF